jgi:hypothetical protein
MDLAMFCSFYNQLVHEITYDSSHAIKGIWYRYGNHTIKGIWYRYVSFSNNAYTKH